MADFTVHAIILVYIMVAVVTCTDGPHATDTPSSGQSISCRYLQRNNYSVLVKFMIVSY